MKKLILLIVLPFFFSPVFAGNGSRSFHFPANVGSSDYMEGSIIIKVNADYRGECGINSLQITSVNSVFNKLDVTETKKMFPHHQPPASSKNEQGFPLTDLSLIYSVKYAASIPVDKAIDLLLSCKEIFYAEPVYINKPLYIPNDTLAGAQYHHIKIKTFEGWDIQKGDTNIVIGLTDTGIDSAHVELVNQVKYNYADPINGIDDDGDGYIDNYRGWNVAFNTNDVQGNSFLHGNFVAGIASAQVDNITGIAGVGFKTKFLPVNCAPNSNVIVNGDVAIVYAADHGCAVINCSWGGFGSSQFSQDVVNYATFNKNSLVVGAAGNANNDAPFYPASYQYVLSVGGSDSTDQKWISSSTSGSSYGSYLDVCAPGNKIYSIFPTGSATPYWYSGGTSEAAPQVSAIAALVKAQFPALTALQIGERIRATCDNIDTIPFNIANGYVKKLGKGRVNLYRALTEAATSVRALDIKITDNNDDAFVVNDTMDISAVFTNFLDPLSNLNVTLTSNSPDINILNPTLNFASLGTLQSDSNRANPFHAIINPSIPRNTKVVFTLTFGSGSYSDFQSFEVTVNVDYLNVLVNDIGVTITSKGRLGYNDTGLTQGIGFTQNEGPNLMYAGSLMVGVNDSMVSDATSGTPAGAVDNDFVPVDYIREIIPPVVSEYDLVTRYNDSGNTLPVGVIVTHKTFAWSTVADRKYVITEYTITNTSATNFNGLYAGIYSDWDITSATYSTNRALYDAALKMGYAFEVLSNTNYAGIKQLTPGNTSYYAFNNDGTDGSVNVYDGFTRAEKYQCMNGAGRSAAGTNGNGTDISMLLSAGPFTVNAGDSVKVAFALVGGDNLTDITQAALAAQVKYNTVGIDNVNASNENVIVYPNPSNGYITVQLNAENNVLALIELLDAQGKLINTQNKKLVAGNTSQVHIKTNQLAQGIYFIKVTTATKSTITKISVQ